LQQIKKRRKENEHGIYRIGSRDFKNGIFCTAVDKNDSNKKGARCLNVYVYIVRFICDTVDMVRASNREMVNIVSE
jgi:hypothetical protein